MTPIAIIIFVVDALMIIHAAKTGRVTPWAYVILVLPGIGAAAYFFIEMLPEWLGSYQGQKLQAEVGKRINPDKDYRRLRDECEIADTLANRQRLAEVCLGTGRFDKARQLYESLLADPRGQEPLYYMGLAKAFRGLKHPQLALAKLDELKSHWPDYQSQDGHLLYACLNEEAGNLQEALQEYAEIGRYYAGAEPRARHAMLLAQMGRTQEAKAEAEDILRVLRRSPRHVQKSQSQWKAVAEKLAKG